MEQPTEKKGMSKGCMIGLIVGLVFLAMIIAAAVTCYFKADDLAKFGVVTLVNNTKTMVADSEIEGVDTVKYNAVVDGFVERLNEDEFDAEKFTKFAENVRPTSAIEQMDSTHVRMLLDAMMDYYPDLESLYPDEPVVDPAEVIDSVATDQM
jgi:hypothetical protein